MITYLAEGATGSFFDTRIALANPTATTARVLARYQKDDGTVVSDARTMPPFSRLTIDVDGVSSMASAAFSSLIEADVQVVADRTMTWGVGGYGSHAERGVLTRTATTWFLAEGATHGSFDLFYLIQNPGPVAAAVEIAYLRPAPLTPIIRPYVVGPNSRQTIRVDDVPGLAETDVSAAIRTTNAVPIIVERAMYFTRPDQVYAAGHESAGVTAPQTRWFLAEGATGSFFNMFILIANPSTDAASVQMDYLLTNGQTITRTHTVGAGNRLTLNVAEEAPQLASAQHVDGGHVHQRRADRRRARDVVAGAGLQLAGSAQQPGRDRHRHALGGGRGRVGRTERHPDLPADRQHLDLRRHRARAAGVRGRHDGGEAVLAAGEQPDQRQRRRRVPGRGRTGATAR